MNISRKLDYFNNELVLRVIILIAISVLSFCVRLFSIIRFESIIHEYDPWFNYRSTKALFGDGNSTDFITSAHNFLNWFDSMTWYPLGRNIGETVYPGLMFTSVFFYYIFNLLGFPINIRNICVMISPIFAVLTSLVSYSFTELVHGSKGAGLFAAAFISVNPGYISRSVAGSYDNESISIFAMIFTFYLWMKALKTGSILWSSLASLGYFYMASAWGGYIFIINMIPLHVIILLICGYYSQRLYISYSTFYVLGTILSMQVKIIGLQPFGSSEHFFSFGTFGLLQLYAFINYLYRILDRESFKKAVGLIVSVIIIALAVFLICAPFTDFISPWKGRLYSFFDPVYAKSNNPIVASVSEHQPTTWASYYIDFNFILFLIPAGFYFCFKKLNEFNIFVILYAVTVCYFSGIMVRLILVFSPIACVLGAIAISETIKNNVRSIKPNGLMQKIKLGSRKKFQMINLFILVGIMCVVISYVFHCVWVTERFYSSNSFIFEVNVKNGSKIIYDDFRDAYWWLRQNTDPNARIMSWWDYGYQITGMANRTTIVDNNTWNNSHIAEVGTAMSSLEEDAIKIIRTLDVDYVLVIFGGLSGYSSDDINKFLWMVRISGSTHPTVKEMDYFSAKGEYRIDSEGSSLFRNCLLYKLCYYRTSGNGHDGSGYDFVRKSTIGNNNITLKYFEESFTSKRWIVRIYKVKPLENLGEGL